MNIKITSFVKLLRLWSKTTTIITSKFPESLESGVNLTTLSKKFLWSQTEEFWEEFEKEIKKNRNRTSKYRIPLSLKQLKDWKAEKFAPHSPAFSPPDRNFSSAANSGLIVAEILDKTFLKTKRGESFYKLKIDFKKNLTKKISFLTLENDLDSLDSSISLFVFTNEGLNRYAYTLEKNLVYVFWVIKYPQTSENYLKVKDWKKLGDQRTIERTLQLITREKPTELLTNEELLLEIKDRMRKKRIAYQITAVSSSETPELDLELKDEESNYRLDLKP